LFKAFEYNLNLIAIFFGVVGPHVFYYGKYRLIHLESIDKNNYFKKNDFNNRFL